MVIGADYRVELMNRAARQFSSGGVGALESLSCYQILHQRETPCNGVEHPCPLEQVRESGQPVTVVHEHYQADGERRLVEIVASPLWGEDGAFKGIIESIRDITERKRAEEALQKAHDELERRVEGRTAELVQANEQLEQVIEKRQRAAEALRESQERFRNLFEHVPLCIFEVDLTQTPPTILQASRQAEQVYGWSSEEFVSAPIDRIIPPEATPKLARMVEAVRAGSPITVESVNLRRDGSAFPVRISAASERNSGLSRVILTVEDITMEKERRSEEEAIVEERRRIAREIHDGLAQDLGALRLRTRLWYDLIGQNPAQMRAELDAMRELLSENIREVRRSVFALRPVALDELGFYPALNRFLDEFGEQHQLRIDLRTSGPEERLLPHLEPVLFRIVQEALNNVGKHAHAGKVSVELHLEAADEVSLRIRDNGRGFDTVDLDQAVREGHLGLKQMRERVVDLKGTFELRSQPGSGTEIRVVLPMP
ncbi:MAG: PAS domain S-box protein [Chloroflexi bacterium]|nr:PAS domain S-box protein [Chloroflexota bacterium]